MSKKNIYLREDESVSSLKVFLEGLFVTLVIDAYKNRDVTTFNIPGAYFYAPNPEDKQVLLNLKGLFVDIMCQVNPEYKRYVRIKRGQQVLFLLTLRAFYGHIKSDLLW